MTDPVEIDAPCCNEREPDGVLCGGTMRAGWPEFVCDTCRARCGAQVHPTHAITSAAPPREDDGAWCADCGVVVSKWHEHDGPTRFTPPGVTE